MSAKVELALPVTEVMRPIVMVVALTPGALAVLVALPEPVVAVPPAAVVAVLAAVVGDELVDELPQAAASKAITPHSRANRWT